MESRQNKTPDPVEEYYRREDAGDRYEKRWGYSNPLAAEYWSLRNRLIERAIQAHFGNGNKNLRVLEVGTGHGHELAKLAAFGLKNPSLLGVDLIDSRLKRAKKEHPDLLLSRQNGVRLGFADNVFDIVMQLTCMMHVTAREEREKACREFHRVLKPGGLLIWWDLAPLPGRTLWAKEMVAAWTPAPREWMKIFKTIFTIPQISRLIFAKKRPADLPRDHATQRPISPREIKELFPGMEIRVKHAGLDFDLWNFFWRRTPDIGNFLWKRGFFPQHCFAVGVKN